MIVLFDADVPVHYGFMFLTGGDEHPDLGDTWAGQQNGLAGAATPASCRGPVAGPPSFRSRRDGRDPLEALVDAFSHAKETCDGQAHDLLTGLRSRFPFPG